MEGNIPLVRDLVLVGGGHTHALVLRMWAMRPLAGIRLTLVNPHPTAPYSGMLPGHVAGHYARADLEIDLVRLARFAGARLVIGSAEAIDPQARELHVAGHPAPIGYDIASIDIGIHAEMPEIEGFRAHGTAVKPLDIYAERWNAFLARAGAGEVAGEVAVIGGGIAGAELALAMAHALRARGADPGRVRVTLIEAGDDIVAEVPATRRHLARAMARLGVALCTGARAVRIGADRVVLEDGREIPARFTVAAAGARAHGWLARSPLPLTDDGFVKVGPDLGVLGHDDLFAAGDCAHLTHAPRPKAGVFAVRAAPVLLHNLRASLTGARRRPFRPQKDYLKLISLGGRDAIAEKWGLSLAHPLLWRWKDRIDRRFMAQFRALPQMPAPALPAHVRAALGEEGLDPAAPLCAGCGAKVAPATLGRALAALPPLPAPARDEVLTGAGDDAAVLALPGNRRQVLSVDHLRAFSEDPALFARIAAVHALGDVWAMGARPQAALLSLTLPRMTAPLQARTLREILAAVSDLLAGEGCALVGGHSTMGSEMSLGLTVTGITGGGGGRGGGGDGGGGGGDGGGRDGGESGGGRETAGRAPVLQAGARAGDALILTRPIGSGTLLAGEMAMRAEGRDIAALLATMATPQGDAAALLAPRAHAMSDVTGFGLAGHLMAICRASQAGARLDLAALPLYRGARALAAAGQRSTIWAANRAAAPVICPDESADPARLALLHDPQTAGGLLAAVAPEEAEELVAALRAMGHEQAAIIGTITEGPPAITCR